jgi:hypothetical protein
MPAEDASQTDPLADPEPTMPADDASRMTAAGPRDRAITASSPATGVRLARRPIGKDDVFVGRVGIGPDASKKRGSADV